MRAVGRSEHFERNQCRWVALSPVPIIEKIYVCTRGRTEDIISYFTLMSSEIHYYDIIEKMGSWTLMSSEV